MPQDAQGDVYYSTTGELTADNYSTAGTKNAIPTGTDAGSYTLFYYTPGNTNYGERKGNVSTSIGKTTG